MKILERLRKKPSLSVCSKGVGSNSSSGQFCRCWMHKECSGIRGKPKHDSEFKCEICAIQRTDITEDCLDVKLRKSCVVVVTQYELGCK